MIAATFLLLLFSHCARATEYRVGATRELKTFSAVAGRLRAGDIVMLDAGVYPETVKLTASGTRALPILIRGVGAERAVFDVQDLDTSGRGPIPRAAFQIEGANIVLEHLEFTNARNGENAAGIRLLNSTDAIIRDCKITRCDMGIFGGDTQTALIENCEIAFNGTEKFNGYSHNLYLSGNRIVVRNCRVHDAPFGQNVKSRAHYNELWFNWIYDSNEGEIGCVDEKGNTDKPNSNTLLVGNLVVSKAGRTGNGAKFVLFGSESGASHDGTLYLFHNTFIAGESRIQFVTLSDLKARAVIAHNAFRGSNNILLQAQPAASISAQRNWLPPTAPVPQGWTEDASEPLTYVDGDGIAHVLQLESQVMTSEK